MLTILETVLLPDLPAIWRTQSAENPLATPTLVGAADEWVKVDVPFDPKRVDAYISCDFGLFAALFYARLDDVALVRATIQQMHLYFVIDEFTDEEDERTVRRMLDEVVYAFRHPNAPPEGETCLGKLTREFWSRALNDAHCTESAAKRYVKHFEEYLDCTHQQAVDRGNKELRGYEDYMRIRRPGSGAHPSIDLLLAKYDIPDEVYDGPFMQRLLSVAIDLILIVNDVYSFPKELASSDPHHNIVPVVKHARGLSTYQDALDAVGDMFTELTDKYRGLSTSSSLDEFPAPVGYVIRTLMKDIEMGIAGQIEWSFRTKRYFGKRGEEIKMNRRVVLKGDSMLVQQRSYFPGSAIFQQMAAILRTQLSRLFGH